MTRFRPVAAFTVCALAATGCATLNVRSYVERGINVRQYRTYAWAPPEARSTGDPRLDNNRFFDERVRMDVEKELSRKGFEKATVGKPDLLVHYHASITQKIDVRGIDQDSTNCNRGNCPPYVYDAGTLMVDLIDPGSNQVVWRGWSEGSMDGFIDSQEWMESRIDTAIAKVLAQLPIGS